MKKHAHLSQDDKLVHQIRFCGRYLRHNIESKGSQRRVLMIIKEHKQISQKELMEIHKIKSGSISELLTKLEQNGLILRHKSKHDKRRVDLQITESGLFTLDEMQKEYERSLSILFSKLDSQEKEQLRNLLEKLSDSWQNDRNKHENRILNKDISKGK